MIGIYKITNKINNKIYIGKSINIEQRWKEHIRHSKNTFSRKKPPIHRAINKYGKENFYYEILEVCNIDELVEKEIFYIKKFDSTNKKIGYNLTPGGDSGPIMCGEKNPGSVLSDNDVIYIRECYDKGVYKLDCYKEINKKTSLNFNTFNSIWYGKSYKYIKPEVFTEENRIKHVNLSYKHRALKHCHKVKDYVLEIRKLKKNGEKYHDMKKRYSFINVNTFNDIWCNRTFKYIQA